MYGRQQPPPAAYPRQYGHGYPQQPQQHPPQQQYPPQQQQPPQQYAPQCPPQQGAFPPQPQYAPQQQQPPRGFSSQYGALAKAPPPPQVPGVRAIPAARGSLPYGARNVAPAVSSYESQAQKWKKGFSVAPGAAGAASGGGSSRQADVEAPLIAELCASAGSSYPPRDLLQKLLRHLPTLDHEYVCELLDDKLEDRVWQVQGKALSVLDALFKSQEAELYKTHYYRKMHVLEALCSSRKELLKARAEKIYNVVRSHVPPAPPSPEYEQQPDPRGAPPSSSMLPSSPIVTARQPAAEVNLLGSPMLMAQNESADAPPSSAFGFLNSFSAAAAPPSPIAVHAEQPAASAFSFLSSSSTSQPAPAAPSSPLTRVVAVTSVAVPTVDIFSSLPAPTPVAGLAIPQEEPAPTPPPVEEEPKVHDPIHDAFEGLGFGDDDDEADASAAAAGETSDNPLEGFSTASRGTMGSSAAIKVDPSDAVREIILEMDVPAGPMGLMLDKSIPHMAVVQGFLRMPTGERGYLELHPVLCPGCALVSINAMNVEDQGLEEVGAILGSLINAHKVLRFKKLLRSGRTVNPADPDYVYVAPPPEKPEAPPVDDTEEEDDDGEDQGGGDGGEFIARLAGFASQLDDVETQIEELVERDRASLPVGDMKNQLAQLHGNVEKIQTQGIDAVILGANPPANADEIRQLRSSLVRRSDAITKRIQKILTNGTAPSPLVAPTAVGSPEVSAFSFVGGAGAVGGASMPTMPPLQLPQPVAAPAAAAAAPPSSAFSFLQSTTDSPVASPQGAAPAASAFSFLSAPSTPAPPAAEPTSVFAGLSLRGADPPPPALEPASAFGFLSGAANASTPPVGVLEPPRIASPTAFSFLRGATGAASPLSSPAAAAGPPGSAFSFIS